MSSINTTDASDQNGLMGASFEIRVLEDTVVTYLSAN